MPRLESEFEKEVVRWVKEQGGMALKLKNEERGFPDRTIILPQGFIAFGELKRAGTSSKKYHMQEVWVNTLKKFGFPAGFCETLDEVKDLCR